MFIETKRLIITEFNLDMVDDVFRNSLDEDNKRFVPDEVWETIDETKEVLEYLINCYGDFSEPQVFPIILKETNDNIGYVQLVPLDDDLFEIGYHIAKKYTHNNYATEAVLAFLPIISKEAKTNEIYGISLAQNKASIKVLEKCGFEIIFQGKDKYQGRKREIIKAIWKKK